MIEITENEIAYVFQFCDELMTQDEKDAYLKYSFELNVSQRNETNTELWKKFYISTGRLKDSYPSSVTDLLKHGFQTFKFNVASRIINQCFNHPLLNYCPRCSKLARTPQAKQCRFCAHDWH